MKLKIITLYSLLSLIVLSANASNRKSNVTETNNNKITILIIGLPNNVKSNYFPKNMIAEETNISENDISNVYNSVIQNNIIKDNTNLNFKFVKCNNDECLMGANMKGDVEEEQYLDLKNVNETQYHNLLKNNNADYVLFLDQHYLKWQEKPMNTIFHITSYSLYDAHQKLVTNGSDYFTSMELENSDKLAKLSNHSSSKILADVIKCIK